MNDFGGQRRTEEHWHARKRTYQCRRVNVDTADVWKVSDTWRSENVRLQAVHWVPDHGRPVFSLRTLVIFFSPTHPTVIE